VKGEEYMPSCEAEEMALEERLTSAFLEAVSGSLMPPQQHQQQLMVGSHACFPVPAATTSGANVIGCAVDGPCLQHALLQPPQQYIPWPLPVIKAEPMAQPVWVAEPSSQHGSAEKLPELLQSQLEQELDLELDTLQREHGLEGGQELYQMLSSLAADMDAPLCAPAGGSIADNALGAAAAELPSDAEGLRWDMDYVTQVCLEALLMP